MAIRRRYSAFVPLDGRGEHAFCGRGPCSRGDACQAAVQRAYGELLAKGQPDRYAFEAAVTIYRWHHPEVPGSIAQDVVSEWVWNGVRH